jgi:hypothetical protein
MKSHEMRALDEAAVPRPWKWTDKQLLWNEEVDHCVLAHGGTEWPVTPENRAAIESALNHMPALIALVAACERRRLALDARREFGERSCRENPYSILDAVFKEQATSLDGAIGAAEQDLDGALTAVHAVVTPSTTDLELTWRSLARKIPMSKPMTFLHAFVEGLYRADLRDPRLVNAVRKGLAAYGAGSAADASVRDVLESFVLQWVDPARGPKMFLTGLASEVAVLIVAMEDNVR